MEMNAINVARHKLFRWKPSFVDKKMRDEKKADSVNYLQKKIMDNAVPVTTKKLQRSRLDYLAVRIH